jgi:hypothetical protein
MLNATPCVTADDKYKTEERVCMRVDPVYSVHINHDLYKTAMVRTSEDLLNLLLDTLWMDCRWTGPDGAHGPWWGLGHQGQGGEGPQAGPGYSHQKRRGPCHLRGQFCAGEICFQEK